MLQSVPCTSLRPGPWEPSVSLPWATVLACRGGVPLFISRLHLHRSSYPNLIEPSIFSFPHLARSPCGDNTSHLNRHKRSEVLMHPRFEEQGAASTVSTATKAVILSFSRPSSPLDHTWDCGFFRIPSLARWGLLAKIFPPRPVALPASVRPRSVSFRTVSVRRDAPGHGGRQPAACAGINLAPEAVTARPEANGVEHNDFTPSLPTTRATAQPHALSSTTAGDAAFLLSRSLRASQSRRASTVPEPDKEHLVLAPSSPRGFRTKPLDDSPPSLTIRYIHVGYD